MIDARINTNTVRQIPYSSLRIGDVFVCAPFINYGFEVIDEDHFMMYNMNMGSRTELKPKVAYRIFSTKKIILISRKFFDDPATSKPLSALDFMK